MADLKEVQDFFAQNMTQTEVKAYLKTLSKQFVESDEDGISLLNELTKPRVDSALDLFQKENLPKLLDGEIKKRFPETTEEQRKIKELELRVQQMQKETQLKENRIKLIEYLNQNNLSADFSEYLNDENFENAIKKAEKFKELVSSSVQAQTDKIFKEKGRDVKDFDDKNKKVFTKEDYAKMSPDEILKNWDALKELENQK